MKSIILILLILPFTFWAQPEPPHERDAQFGKRFEDLEKLKLLELLDLDEATAVKFFTRRNNMKIKIQEYIHKSSEVFDKLEELLQTGKENVDYAPFIKESLELDEKMSLERIKFIKSLDDILKKEQIAQVILFEHKFKRDVRDILLERGRKRFLKK